MAEILTTVDVLDAAGATKTVATIGNLNTRIGEVQASPTANTVLDRLKAIATALAGTLTVASHAVTNAGTFAVQAAQSGAWLVTNAGTFAVQAAATAAIKVTYGTATAFTKTNAGLSTSATAGWKSNAIDNTATRALDALVGVELAAVNTAPAGTKSLYIYAYGLIEGTAYTSTGDGTIDGTEGTVTFPSLTTLASALKLIGTIPYPVQNRAINGGPFSVAAAFGGVLPDKWGIAMLNDTGMTLSVTNIYYQEITNSMV